MKKEIQLDQLLKTLPEEFRNKSEYDLIYHISEIGQDYDISFEELDKIFSETYNIITGISRIDTLPDNLNIILNPENKINFEKIAKELKQLIEKLMTALGNKFPLKISEMPPEIIETREKKRPSDGEKKYDSDTNTKIIKSVLESEKRSDTKELEIRPEMHPEEIYPDIKKVEDLIVLIEDNLID